MLIPPLQQRASFVFASSSARKMVRSPTPFSAPVRGREGVFHRAPLAASGTEVTLQWAPGLGNLLYTPRKDVQEYLKTEIREQLMSNHTQLKKLVDAADAQGQMPLHTYAEAGFLNMCQFFVDEVMTTRSV